MPWSLTICCIAIVLVLCSLCNRLLAAIKCSRVTAIIFLFLFALAELLPSFSIGGYVILKPYATVLMLLCAALLLAGASYMSVIRGLAGAFLCCCISLACVYFLPVETNVEVILGLLVGLGAFAAGYCADALLISIFLGISAAELTVSFMYLPFFELGTGTFLGSACIAAVPALVLSRIFAHNQLREKQRAIDKRLSLLKQNQLFEISDSPLKDLPIINKRNTKQKDAPPEDSNANHEYNDSE